MTRSQAIWGQRWSSP